MAWTSCKNGWYTDRKEVIGRLARRKEKKRNNYILYAYPPCQSHRNKLYNILKTVNKEAMKVCNL
jgi:hypothetical protein